MTIRRRRRRRRRRRSRRSRRRRYLCDRPGRPIRVRIRTDSFRHRHYTLRLDLGSGTLYEEEGWHRAQYISYTTVAYRGSSRWSHGARGKVVQANQPT